MANKYWVSTSSTSFNTAANYSDGAAPANGDTLTFDARGTASVLTNTTSAVTGLTIYIDSTFPGTIGTISGATQTPLSIPGGTVIIGRDPTGDGQGAPFVYIAGTGTNTLTASVLLTPTTGSIDGLAPVVIQGTVLIANITGGSAAIAPIPGTTTTASVIGVTAANQSTRPTLLIGEGVTATTVTNSGGDVTSFSSNTTGTTVVSNGGTYTSYGSGTHTTISVGLISTFDHRGSHNITTLSSEGFFLRTGDTRSITITTLNAYGGATFLLDNGLAASTTRTTTNLVACGMASLTVSTPIGERF